jgi:hypothetical protein
MLKHVLYASVALALLVTPSLADSTTSIQVQGSVAKACVMGTPAASTLSLGSLIDPATGKLLASIPAASTTITGSWCNTASTISVSASPLVAQSFTGTLPSGFTKAVNYTAEAAGWTAASASFTTSGDTTGGGNSAVAGAANATDPEAATITVNVSNFTTPGTASRLVGDPNYSGAITVTLAPTA